MAFSAFRLGVFVVVLSLGASEGGCSGDSCASVAAPDLLLLQTGIDVAAQVVNLSAPGIVEETANERVEQELKAAKNNFALSREQIKDLDIAAAAAAQPTASTDREENETIMFTAIAFLLLFLVIWGCHQSGSPSYYERMLALDGLRFLMVAGAIVVNLAGQGKLPECVSQYAARMTWGISAFFLLSGFIGGVQLMPKVKCAWFCDHKYMLHRVMRIYPTYLLSIFLATKVVPWGALTEKPYLAVMIPALSAWVPWAVVNPLNTPAWCVGALLLNAILAPALVRFIMTARVVTRWGTLMPFMYLTTLMAAWSQSGHIFTAMEPLNAVLIYVPHVPEFVVGLILGSCYVERAHEETPRAPRGLLSELINAAGASSSLALLLSTLTFPVFDVRNSPYPLVVKWGEQGMLLPIMCMLFWQLASPESYDPLKTLLSSRPFVALGNVSFAAYMMQQFVFACVDEYTPAWVPALLPPAYFEKGSSWYCVPCVWALLAFAFVVHKMFERPFRKISSFLLAPLRVAGAVDTPRVSQRRSWSLPMDWKLTRAAFYYFCFFTCIGLIHYAVTHVFENKGICSTFVTFRGTIMQGPYNFFLWFLMLAYCPGMLMNTLGHLLFPAFVHKNIPAALGQPDDDPVFPDVGSDFTLPPWKLHIRWVTRGDNVELVSQTVRETRKLLDEMNMDPRSYVLEVVTDNAIHCADRAGVPVEEIVVPSDYVSKTAVKFKARALNYAIFNSSAADCDWIIHLDEETKLSKRVVAQIWAHAEKEHDAVERGDRTYRNIGQGAIVYGAEQHGEVPNWITCLADTGRVGDDYGKFRIQYENGATVIGMHGSFIAISQQVEELITYDHGHAGSICEDLYFALYAFGHHNVRFDWIDGFMYEQSPFTMMDLVKQRQRWFSGMFLVCFDNKIPLQQRGLLMCCCFSWNLVPMMALITLFMTFIEGGESYALWRTVSFFNALMMQSYLIGFWMTYSVSEGFFRYLILFIMQINGAPIYGILEAMGAWRAMTRSEGYMGFHVVQKEVNGASGENAGVLAEMSAHGKKSGKAAGAILLESTPSTAASTTNLSDVGHKKVDEDVPRNEISKDATN